MNETIQKVREALDEARKFIAAEYADASAEMYGEWLASEARPVFSKICRAIADMEKEGGLGDGPYGYLLKPIGLNEEHWTLSREPSEYPTEVVSVPLFSREPQMLGASALAALERVVRERDNLQARLTARAKSMLRLREALAVVHDNIEDEGDRTYFGSTNDADTLREVWQDLDAWAWDDIMSDGKMTDVYAASREAHTRAESAEAKLAEARKVIEWIKREAHSWAASYTFASQIEDAARRFLEETK